MSALEERAKTVIAADIRMISGCEDAQTSSDVSDVANFKLPDPAGRGGGACTSGLLQVLYADHVDTSADMTFEQVLLKLRDNLQEMGLSQIPQLSSSRNMDMSQLFHIVPEGCTGTRRAVMIGINYKGQEGELTGCQNDVKNMMEYLKDAHGFQDENITLLLDDKKHLKPTRQNITKAFKQVVQDSEPGDVVFCHFSGHGGKIRDFDGDEEDGFDETLIPVDFEKSGQIRDDYLYKTLVCPLKEGVTMTCLFDCCHSGTVLDLPFVFTGDGQHHGMSTPEGFNLDKIEHAAEAPEEEEEEEEESAAGDDDVEEEEQDIEEDYVEMEEEVEEDEEIEEEEEIEEDVEEEEEEEPYSRPSQRPSSSSQQATAGGRPTNMDDGPPEREVAPSGEMQEVFVRYGRDSITIKADVDEKFLEIRKELAEKTGVAMEDQHLIYNGLGVRFADDKSLRYYGCQGGCFMTLTEKHK